MKKNIIRIGSCFILVSLLSGCSNSFVTEGEETQIIGWGRIRKGTHREATVFGSTDNSGVNLLFAPNGESK